MKLFDNSGNNYGILDYEVGDIFITTNNQNPQERFGGKWELFSKGRTLVGYDDSQSEFNVIKKTGGSKYMQSHTHTASVSNAGNHNHLSSNQYPFVTDLGDGNQLPTAKGNDYGLRSDKNYTKNSGSHTHDIKIDSYGNGNAQNLQPYIVVYIWIRTS